MEEPAKPDLGRLIERQEHVLGLQLDWIRAVDAKTPIVMAVATGMLGVVFAIAPAPDNMTKTAVAWMIVGSAALTVSLVLCTLASFPRTTGPAGSLIFFGGISARPLADYKKHACEQSDEDRLDDLCKQCHRNAEIATEKYKQTRRAVGWLLTGIPLWLAAVYALYQG